MRLSEKIRALDGCIQVYPTTRGWTVRAFYWTGTGWPDRKFHEKKWTSIKEPPVADHTLSRVKEAIGEAFEWLEAEADRV